MVDVRKGNQYPTESFTLPYKKTYGEEAVKLYNSTGRKAMEWQELLIYDILAVNDDELYTHTKFGYSVPRRNGKNELVLMREMYGLVKGEKIIHTAHRTTTTHSAWERLYDALEKAKIEITSSYRASGKEHIEVEGGGKIVFRTRTSKGGLGEGFDLMIIDEAQEYQDDQETALKYVISSSQNPQTLFCGTPPTMVSSGTIFTKMRDRVLSGKMKNTGWAEWSVEFKTDPNDVEAWYRTNPSLGTVFTERIIQDEVGEDDIDFNIQRLGLWFKTNLKSVISESEWLDLKVPSVPKFKGKLFVGIKYGKDGNNVAMSVAVRTEEDNIFIECIDCQTVKNGNGWILQYLSQLDVAKVVIDGAGSQRILEQEIKDAGIKVSTMLPTVNEVIVANTMFEQALFKHTVCHNNQPSLTACASNTEKRAIGSNGGFGYKSIKQELDIALLDSAILAHWLCSTKKEAKKQRIFY